MIDLFKKYEDNLYIFVGELALFFLGFCIGWIILSNYETEDESEWIIANTIKTPLNVADGCYVVDNDNFVKCEDYIIKVKNGI